MNLDNICEGLIVKNYKEMCNLLGEEVRNGCSKKSQLKEWERYFKYHKNGNKFIIDEIFEKPVNNMIKENLIMKNINNGKFSKEIYPIVKNFVCKHDIEYISKGKLLKELGLINTNYEQAYSNPKNFIKILKTQYNIDIDLELLNIMVNSIYSISHGKIHNAFTNLEKLEYIYSYSNKLLVTFDSETYKMDIPTNEDYKILNKCICEGKLKSLSNSFVRSNKSMSEYASLVSKIEKDCNNDIDKMNTTLNTEIFIRGLSKESHAMALKEISKKKQFSNVSNFFYVYGYIKNDAIEWNKEFIDIAKENICLNNYKEKVKSMFTLDSFLEKWFDTEHDRNDKSSNIYSFKKQFHQHEKDVQDDLNKLFDILTSADTKIRIIVDNKTNNKVVNDNSIENLLPF